MRWRDALLASCGVLFGAPSLAWPFGWDTAVHYYVGREWALRGAVPYRDSFDHKPPLIHLIHAASVSLFGEGMWGIRVVELACVVVLGLACASLAWNRREGRPPDGLRGVAVLASSVFYYGFFDYWNTAQCELAGTTLGALALLAAVRVRRLDRAALVAGVVTGALASLKPPMAAVAFVSVVVLVRRALVDGGGARPRGRKLLAGSTLVRFAAGALLVPGLFVAYFAAHHATKDLVDFVVFANLAYLENEPRLTTLAEVADHLDTIWRGFSPVAGLLAAASIAATADALVRRSRVRASGWAMAWAMLAVSLVAIGVQLKFYYYHWITALAGVVLMVALVVADLSRVAGCSRRAWLPVAVAVGLVAAFSRTGVQAESWWTSTSATVHWLRGDWDRARFARTFQTWDGTRKFADVEAAGDWIGQRSSPEDTVLVRGVAAEIYVISRRRAPGRYFWTAFLTRPSRQFHREEMLAEDRRTIAEKRPRFVVTWAATHQGIESAEWFESMGYVERARLGDYVVLERGPSEAP